MGERLPVNVFPALVSQEALSVAGFKDCTPSRMVQREDILYNLYYGFIPSNSEGEKKGLHIIIGERIAFQGFPRAWFFGTFEGPAWAKMTSEESLQFRTLEMRVLDEKRVGGKRLEGLIWKSTLPTLFDR